MCAWTDMYSRYSGGRLECKDTASSTSADADPGLLGLEGQGRGSFLVGDLSMQSFRFESNKKTMLGVITEVKVTESDAADSSTSLMNQTQWRFDDEQLCFCNQKHVYLHFAEPGLSVSPTLDVKLYKQTRLIFRAVMFREDHMYRFRIWS